MKNTSALLRIVLAVPGVHSRAAFIAILLAVRPALTFQIQRSVGRIVLSGIMFDQSNLLRHTLNNLAESETKTFDKIYNAAAGC